MKIDTNNFDCRTIQNGRLCGHLSPWNINAKEDLARVCTCKALNVVIFPDYKDLGKITQELIKVKPLFHCPKMQKLRVKGNASSVVATIDKNDFTAWHHD